MAVPPQPPGSGMPGQPPFGQPPNGQTPQHPAPQGMPGAPPPGAYPQQPGQPYPAAQYPGAQFPGGYPQQPVAPGYPQQYPQQPGYPAQQPGYPQQPYGAPQQPPPAGQYPGAAYPPGAQFPPPAGYQGGYGAPPAPVPGQPYPPQQYPQQHYPQSGAPQYAQPPFPPQFGQAPPVRGTTQPVPGQYSAAPQYPGAPQYPSAPQYPGAPAGAMPQAPRPPQTQPPQPQAPWAGGTFAAPGLPPATAPANRTATPPGAPLASPPAAPPQPAARQQPPAAPPKPGAPKPAKAPPASPSPAGQAPAKPKAAAPGGADAPSARQQPASTPDRAAPPAGSPAVPPSSRGPKPAADSPAGIAAAARAAEMTAGTGVRQEPPNPEDEEVDPVEELKKNAVPLLVSFAVHLALIIVLGLMVKPYTEDKKFELQASIDAPGEESLAEIRSLSIENDAVENPDQKPPASLIQLPDPVKVPINVFGAGPVAPLSIPTNAPPGAAAAAGRVGALKESLLRAKGGTKQTEEAVEMGLNWLTAHQLPSGMWSLTGEGAVGKGKYSKGSKFENNEAATAMALLAYFGAGHTPSTGGKHSAAIDKAVKALLRSQDAKGNFFQGKKADDWMYSHALCTMAICEYLALEPTNTSLRAPCEKAVKFCVESQHDMGGWRYSPRGDSDTSVTGWMLMALQSAKNAKVKVPPQTLDKITFYLDKAAVGLEKMDMRANVATKADVNTTKLDANYGSRYSYQPGMDYDHVMTAEGLLCRMYLGWQHGDARLKSGCDFLLAEHMPRWEERDVYYWYYATQTMFHMEGEYWDKWNGALRDMLVANQEQSGPERGSWNPLGGGPLQQDGADLWSMNNAGGRLYVTCFSLYMLEVYYRHLPLYSELKKQMLAREPTQ